MGIKRPLEEEDPESSFLLPKQPDCNKKLSISAEESSVTSMRVDSSGGVDDTSCKLQVDGGLENGERDAASIGNKELEASAPLSEEDARNGGTSVRYVPGCDYSLPRHPPEHFEDPYIYLLNSSPRKEIPIGPDHQAELPLTDLNVSGSNYFAEQKPVGTCIIPMPDLNDGVAAGRGRTECGCLDVGSMRCVQQHVKEVRERLRDTIGDEKFMELGFCDMGDEVACKWTPDEEELFYDVVLSNPASHGRKFWKHLRFAFPTHTKQELVSYYFNVFMLRRRAIQNRSYVLEIDSDNDEERKGAHGDVHHNGFYSLDPDSDDEEEERQLVPNGECHLVEGGDEGDSTVESFGDQELDASWVDVFWSEPENVPKDDHDHDHNQNHITPQDNVEKENDEEEELSGQKTNKSLDS